MKTNDTFIELIFKVILGKFGKSHLMQKNIPVYQNTFRVGYS